MRLFGQSADAERFSQGSSKLWIKIPAGKLLTVTKHRLQLQNSGRSRFGFLDLFQFRQARSKHHMRHAESRTELERLAGCDRRFLIAPTMEVCNCNGEERRATPGIKRT